MKIEFIPTNQESTQLAPVPAVTMLPDWYKNLSPFWSDKKQQAYPDGTKNITVKWCNPLGDALGSGYFILLENEVQVRQKDGSALFTWHRGGPDFIGTHDKKQFSNDLVPEGYEKSGLKFTNLWGVRTPKGYSTLFTHPLNDLSQPFLTLAGVVDTDRYNAPVNFPFFIKEGFEGSIMAGTPIAQLLPFKRDKWQSEIRPYENGDFLAADSAFRRHITRAYKRFYWSRKEYK